MTKQEIADLLKRELPDLRPCLIKYCHDKRIEEYKQLYKKLNNGKSPSKADLSRHSNMLITKGTGVEDAEILLVELVEILFKEFKKETFKKRLILSLVNSVIFVMLLTLAGNFIALYLSSLQIGILDTYNPLTFPNVLNAALIILMTVIYYIYSFFKK